MGDQSQSNRSNPRIESRRQGSIKKKSEFEFCKVCNLNHNQGLRHKPEHASRNRFWCVFCDTDVDELTSSFACANAINHLASVNHLKNLKQFSWKYGGSMDQLEAFIVSDADVAKWEKKCVTLQKEPVLLSEERRKEVSNSGISEASNACVLPYYSTSSLPSETCSGANSFHSKDFSGSCHALSCSGRQWSSDGYSGTEEVPKDGTMLSRFEGLPDPSAITLGYSENVGSNVPSEAPPPWLTDGLYIHYEGISGDLVPLLNKSGKSQKLNPKRVGAAWAERRKIELEMEKRGEIVRKDYDANWLPNFGGVWQSGTRKESRKEFEREKQKLFKVEVEPEIPTKIQPCVSKRMKMDDNGGHMCG
ncbi:hypothetical protein QN277_006602 [Acacia crassicarpa]|uniref:TITAN-like protein n=1 Tax=Acacia crassicarpa TaxID=499986 RepID=A0AAE1M8W4_9FABA|nr:hypothetical protein QN277_006602 [Acacia crassicarpa]